MKVSANLSDWSQVVYCKLENQQIDFKAPQNWNTIGRVGRAKLARHAIAMANTLGGYVVIGVGEDTNGTPNQYIGMSDEEASSFDPSTVGQSISSFADPPVSLDIVRPVLDGRRYVVMVIYPFQDMPHVCSNGCENELQRGAFYVRTPDARSKVAVKASELHLLIQRSLRNQRQMLGRMLRGILYEDRQTEMPEMELLAPMLEHSRQLALEKLGKRQIHTLPYFELVCHPVKLFRELGLSDLRRAVDAIEQQNLYDFGPVATAFRSESFATNDSLCGMYYCNDKAVSLWEFYKSGFFHVAAVVDPEQPESLTLDGARLAELVIFSMRLLGQLYTNLGHPEALLDIAVRIPNSNGVTLGGVAVSESSPAVCRVMDIEVSKQRSAGDLEGGASAETAKQFFAEICELFNAPQSAAELAEIKLSFLEGR